MSKTSNNGFFNDKNRANGMTQYQSNPNLANFNQYQKLNKQNNRTNFGGNIANNLGGVGKLDIDDNYYNEADNGFNETNKMSRTTIGFRPLKQTYEEKLDNFMINHNLKYIEPTKIVKKQTPAQNENGQIQSSITKKEKKNSIVKGENININKKTNLKKK